MKPVEETG